MPQLAAAREEIAVPRRPLAIRPGEPFEEAPNSRQRAARLLERVQVAIHGADAKSVAARDPIRPRHGARA